MNYKNVTPPPSHFPCIDFTCIPRLPDTHLSILSTFFFFSSEGEIIREKHTEYSCPLCVSFHCSPALFCLSPPCFPFGVKTGLLLVCVSAWAGLTNTDSPKFDSEIFYWKTHWEPKGLHLSVTAVENIKLLFFIWQLSPSELVKHLNVWHRSDRHSKCTSCSRTRLWIGAWKRIHKHTYKWGKWERLVLSQWQHLPSPLNTSLPPHSLLRGKLWV